MKAAERKAKSLSSSVRSVRLKAGIKQFPESKIQRAQIRNILFRTKVQPKLTVGVVNDKHEREADAMADKVMRMPDQKEEQEEKEDVKSESNEQVQRQVSNEEPEEEQPPDQIQRQAAGTETEGESSGVGSSDNENVSEQEEEPWPEPVEGEIDTVQSVQRKESNFSSAAISNPNVSSRIASPSSGYSLPSRVRSYMEPRFNYDFSTVQVHDSSNDKGDAARLNARAFTYKNHIWLGHKESVDDRRLMAHELTHVVQQRSAIQKKPTTISLAIPKIQRKSLKEKALDYIAEKAEKTPGFYLLSVILGRNPITDKTVPQTPVTFVEGFLKLTDDGDKTFKNLQKSGALERAFSWLKDQVKLLNLTWVKIKSLFHKAWDMLSYTDIFSPTDAFEKIKNLFMPVIKRIKRFAIAVGKKVLEFIMEGILKLAGPMASKIMNVMRKAGNVFSMIVNNPIGFVKNLVKSVHMGFNQFKDNIWTHLKAGLFGWLFGTLSKASLVMPEKFNLKGIVSIVLQVLGLTYDRIKMKLVKIIGAKRVAYIEKAIEIVKILVTEGLAGVWQKLLEYIGSLKDMVLGAIKNWVVTKIIQSAVIKLVSMLNPAGAIIQAIMAIYNTIVFFIERMKQIAALVQSVLDSISNIAMGKLTDAANYVEQTMARTLPVIISFLARLLGLGGVAGKIKKVIKKIQKKVDKAITKVINFIVAKAKKLFGAVVGKGKAVAGKVVAWWKQRKKFEVNGKSYEVYTDGSKENIKLLISSSPGVPYSEFLKKYPSSKERTEAIKLAKDLEKPKSRNDDPITNANNKVAIFNKISTLLRIIATTRGKLPPTAITFGNVTKEGGGTEMKASILSKDHPKGSGVLDKGTKIWTDLGGLRKGSGNESNPFIQGHLLNDNIGGPGRMQNLTPIRESANREHLHSVEAHVKKWIGKGNIAYYHVKADYPSGILKRTSEQVTLEKKSTLTSGERKKLKSLKEILATRRLVKKFICTAYALEYDNGTWKQSKINPVIPSMKSKKVGIDNK